MGNFEKRISPCKKLYHEKKLILCGFQVVDKKRIRKLKRYSFLKQNRRRVKKELLKRFEKGNKWRENNSLQKSYEDDYFAPDEDRRGCPLT